MYDMVRPASILVFFVLVAMIIPVSSAHGHGLGLDTISSISVDGKKISLAVELPMNFDSNQKQITITATDDATNQNVQNITLLVGIFHEGEMILRNYFFTQDGSLAIQVLPDDGNVQISGEQYGPLNAWRSTDEVPLEISGPIFQTAGLYTFEIELRGIDDPANIIDDQEVHRADLTIIDTVSFEQTDSAGDAVQFKVKSYFDKVSDFTYDPEAKAVTFDMPFDWSEKTILHIPVIHVETHIPKDFAEYLGNSYEGSVNGIDLFKSSVTIDDYTEEDERIIHIVLLTDHLRALKNQMKDLDELPNNMAFALTASEENQFPLTAYTAGEEFSVDLSWEPPEVMPEESTNFIFTIRDGITGEPLRQSKYNFVILQNGQEVHRANGEATVGGAFERFTFSESQTGPTIIKFEDIRGTGAETEFGLVVVPEFGSLVALTLVISMMAAVIFGKRYTRL